MDKVAGSVEQVHSANKELMPKQAVHTRCSTQCQHALEGLGEAGKEQNKGRGG